MANVNEVVSVVGDNVRAAALARDVEISNQLLTLLGIGRIVDFLRG